MNVEGGKFVAVGGAGLIGSHTIDALLARGAREVLVFGGDPGRIATNLREARGDSRLKFFGLGADVLRRDMMEKAVEGADGVFHFAALWLLQCHEFPRSAFDVNIEGSFNLMDACVRQGVRKLVFSSSRSAYGEALTGRIDEDHPLHSENFYGASKIAAEALLHAYHHRYGLDYVTLRYMNVYGSRQAHSGPYVNVIMKMLNAIDAGDGPTIMGDGSEAFDFIAVEDCARANLCAMEAPARNGAYNVATGQATTLRQLAELLLELTGSTAQINYVRRSTATSVRSSVGNPSRAVSEIGFTAGIALREGLKRLIAWREEDRMRSISKEARP